MNGNSMVVEWDDSNFKEIEEAKALYIKARKEGRKIFDMAGELVEGFKTTLKGFRIAEKEMSDTQFAVRFIDDSGDDRVIWDSSVKKEVREAEKRFTEYLDKGWRAYAVESNGDRGRRITKFDAKVEEISFADGKVMSLLRFAQAFGSVQVLPKTRKA